MTDKWRCVLAVVLAVALLPFAPLQQIQAAGVNTETVSIQVTYGQTEARKMLAEVNKIRAEEGVAEPAVFDYGLEKCAMQRAAENAVDYMGWRPGGRSTYTIYAELLTGFAGTYKEVIGSHK